MILIALTGAAISGALTYQIRKSSVEALNLCNQKEDEAMWYLLHKLLMETIPKSKREDFEKMRSMIADDAEIATQRYGDLY